jgi:hypothetical protein
MDVPRIYCDLHNCDVEGRVRLICAGTVQDLQTQQIELKDGIILQLYTDDEIDDPFIFSGRVEFSSTENIWVAVINWDQIKNLSQK